MFKIKEKLCAFGQEKRSGGRGIGVVLGLEDTLKVPYTITDKCWYGRNPFHRFFGGNGTPGR